MPIVLSAITSGTRGNNIFTPVFYRVSLYNVLEFQWIPKVNCVRSITNTKRPVAPWLHNAIESIKEDYLK